MAIKLAQGFQITSVSPIDSRLVLSKQEMLEYNLNVMPEKYLAVCKDDGKLYIFDKSITPNSETGYFRSYEEVIDIPAAIRKSIVTESGKEAMEVVVGETLPGAIQKLMSDESGKEAITQSIGSTLPEAILKTLENETSGRELVQNMFDGDQFTLNENNKIEFKINDAIDMIEAIDGMA